MGAALKADGTAGEAKTGEPVRGAFCGRAGRGLARRRICSRGLGGASWPFGGKWRDCPTAPTNGVIAAAGARSWVGSCEGVAGDFPLEWVAPHAVGAKGKAFPFE